jgi:hypothetical protein
MLFEKLRGDVGLHGFIGNGFRPIFTKFERSPVIWVRPSAPGTVKTFLLVDHREGFDRFAQAHFGDAMNGRRGNGWYSCSLCFGFSQF